MQLIPSSIPGCVELLPKLQKDARGGFLKIFQESAFRRLGLVAAYREDFLSYSRPGVIRGLHLQQKPHAQAKVVYCVKGRILDVVLDLRLGSAFYGKFVTFELSAERGNGVYLPPGLAHGFCVLGDEEAIVAYKVSAEYAPECEIGVRWDSAGIPWPIQEPILSDRDRALPSLANFKSSFDEGVAAR
ncbi:MAG: dTDP-4-dehydrorhamnose 3,5-epimerase [Oligoflexia bacterium]|nr:dTDP-4-dehydrorhamnose 3,5-epimerase [Oligoflexia bacterium]